MSEDRETPPSRAAETTEPGETPGAPVEETLASETEVLRAVKRSRDASDAADASAAAGTPSEAADATDGPATAGTAGATAGAAGADTSSANDADAAAAERAHRQAVSELDTQLDMSPAPDARTAADAAPAPAYDELPSAAPGVAPTATLPPVRDGEIRISTDHPMAALYTQTPMPPDIRGNRGAGVLISLLATVVFAALYLGAIALWIAPSFPPSQYVDAGIMPWLTSWLFIIPSVVFFVGLVLLVLVVGRAGWWAYVLGGFLVAVLVWFASMVTLSLAGTPYATPQEMLPGFSFGMESVPGMVNRFGLTVPAIAAAVVAREVTVWFGAWIGARGRRMKTRNAEALAEYESALSEAQATQP